MKSSFLFESWHSWKVCFVSGVKKFFWGSMRMVTCIILGIVSLVVAAWRAVVRFIGLNPSISLCAFIALALLVWMLTFVQMRARAIGAECQRDAIAWQYMDFKEKHGYE